MSFSNEQAAIAAEARIKTQHVLFRQQLTAFSKSFAADADDIAKRERFHELLGHTADFANICEQAVGDASLLGATRNEAWARNSAETSVNALDTILQAHEVLEVLGADLDLPEQAFRPSPTAYASTQRHAAIFFPERVDDLRRRFECAGLPVVGFDEEAPLSLRRLEVRALLNNLRALLRDASKRARNHPEQSVGVGSLSSQLLNVETEGAKVIARDAHWLRERWAGCLAYRQNERDDDQPDHVGEVSVGAVADELSERLAILGLVDTELAKDDAKPAQVTGEFFHVLARRDGEEPAIVNDLTREQLVQLVKPLKAGRAIRLDGRAVDINYPHLKLARTDRDSAHFRRELELYRKRTGDIDFSVDARQLPIEKGVDVTAEFLGAVAPKKATKRGGNAVASTHNTIVWLAGILGLATIAAGIVALVFRATGSTKLTFVGLGLDTSSVGVGCIVIGLLICWLPWRSVLRSMKDLEEIKTGTAKKRKPKSKTTQ